MTARKQNGHNWGRLSHLLWVGLIMMSACQTVPGPQAKTDEPSPRTGAAQSTGASAPRPSPKESMAAMQRELNAELRAPTGVASLEAESQRQSAPPPKTAAQPTPPTQSTTSSNCSGPSTPDWWSLKAPLEDVGDSTVSQEDADKAARVAVIKQLEVKVTGKDVSFQQETTGGAFSYSVSSEVVEQVNIGISGLKIVKRYADACRSRYYARAQLDWKQAVDAWQIELRSLTGQRQELMRQVAEAQTRRDFLALLDGWARALELDGTATLLERRIEFLAPDQRPAEPSARRMEQDRQELDARLALFQLRKVSGDEQRAVTGAQLEQPLVVRLQGGIMPVRDVPVQFTVETGQAEVDPTNRTDAQGDARTTVRQIAGEASGQIVARVPLDHLAALLPASLRPRLAERSEQLAARFTMLSPLYQVTTRLRTLATDAVAQKATATERQQQGDLLHALLPLYRLAETQEEWAKLVHQLDGIPAAQRPALTDPGDPKFTRRQLDQLLDALQIRKQGGDAQTAKPGKPLALPLSARIVAALPDGDKPIPDLPIRFTFETGEGELDPLVRTDANGRADAVVRQVAPGVSKSSVIGRVDLEQLGMDLPPALKQELDRRLSPQVARFSITPPAAFTEGSPLGKSLHELALKLAGNVNNSQGSSAVMRDFLENRTKRRMSVSSRIESSLSAGLSQTGALQIVESIPPAVTTRSVSKEGNAPAAAVFGVYEAEADGSLWITAKIIRLSDQVTEATAEGSIPRSALTESDARELSSLRQSAAPAPILAVPAPNQSFSQWVEAFWDLRNPSGFKTELVAERPQYQADQKAIFRFRTTQDCYLSVVNIGASGAWTVLLPNAYRSDLKQTLVRASDGWVTIPDRADQFDFTVSRPFGTERIKTVCTTRPITLVQNMDLSQGLFQLTPKDGSKLRDLNVTGVTVRQEDWSEAHAEIVTLEGGQSETRGLRGLKSRGLVSK